MDPSVADLGAITTIAEAMDWVGIGQPLWLGFTAQTGQIALLRDVVHISRVDFDAAVAATQVDPAADGNNRAALPVEKGKLRSLRRVARIKLGLNADEADPAAAGAIVAVGAAALPVGGGAGTPERKIKLGSILDQASEAEFAPLSTTEIADLFNDYQTARGAPPHPSVEPTEDQISGMSRLINGGAVPYADFSVFGTHGARLVRKLMFTSFVFNVVTGTWHKAEQPGPPDFDTWWKSWKTYKCLMLLLKAIDVEHLDAYGELVRDFANTYGASCWWLCYQADVRMRAEEWGRLRRHLASEKRKWDAAGVAGFTLFAENRPWNAVCRAASDPDLARGFWDRELKDKVIVFLSHLRGPHILADDDTAGRPSLAESQSRPSKRAMSSAGDREPDRQRQNKGKGDGKDKTPNMARKDPNGVYTHNKRGLEICRMYNEGKCTDRHTDPPRAHQCNICLDTHPATKCRQKSGKGGKADAGRSSG